MSNVYSQSVVEYCERVGNSLLSEPINLFSNLAFFIAAFFAYRLITKLKLGTTYKIISLIILIIGIGSSAWHSVRTPFAHAMDFLPIFAFFMFYLYQLLKRLTTDKYLPFLATLGLLGLQIAMSILFPTVLNGSVRHVVNLFLLSGLIYILNSQNKHMAHFIWMFICYLLAVIFRTLDNTVCSNFPIGTHFLWHILTASTVYLAFRSLISLDQAKLSK